VQFSNGAPAKQGVTILGELPRELGFKIVGYVLMPEHFQALIWPSEEANPSQMMQKLEDGTALFILTADGRSAVRVRGQRYPHKGRIHPDKKNV
jgi:REP element-mobilizing transposase RayT